MKRIRYVLRSLFNNKIILEGRKRHALESTIVFLLAMVIALVPSFVSSIKVKGSAFLNSSTNSVDTALVEFSKELDKKAIDFEIKENENKSSSYKHVLITDTAKWQETFGDHYTFTRYDGNEEVSRLHIYYLDMNYKQFTEKQQSLLDQKYDEKDDTTSKPTSFLLLGKEAAYLAIYNKGNTNWAKPDNGRFITYNRIALGNTIRNFNNLTAWKDFFDKGYDDVKMSSLLIQTSLYLGINLFVSFFMILMIFIVTRGKNNPYRDYKFFEAMKIVGIASLSPALLTCIIGFIIPSAASLMFMLFMGIRTMWMSSKNLSFNYVKQQPQAKK